jgi:RHS repeat-associated protein
LGNNAVSTQGQTNYYFPYGKVNNNESYWGQALQPYKFGGKEEEPMFGLGLYDFEARQYDPLYGRFTSMDPLAEKYYSWSPYAYGFNNPLRYSDPSGMSPLDETEENPFPDQTKIGDALRKIVGQVLTSIGMHPDQIGSKDPDVREDASQKRRDALENIEAATEAVGLVPVVGQAAVLSAKIMSGSDVSAEDIAWTAAEVVPAGLIGKGAKLIDKAGDVANSAINSVKLAKQLASEAQMAEKGITIIGPGKLNEAARLSQQYGGDAADWVKKSSSSFTKNGTTFETHWYENLATGMRTEFKTKFP